MSDKLDPFEKEQSGKEESFLFSAQSGTIKLIAEANTQLNAYFVQLCVPLRLREGRTWYGWFGYNPVGGTQQRRDMSSRQMPEHEALHWHFHVREPHDDLKLFSGFTAGLGDARLATNRDRDGRKLPGKSHISWLGTIGYMALLDQIGKCFKPKGYPPAVGNSICRCLTYFGDLTPPEQDALYALRCALAHDFGLINISTRKPKLTHRFTLTEGPKAPLVKLPLRQWDGDYENMSAENKTTVNLEAFGDLAETICGKVRDLNDKDELEITLVGGSDELLDRYCILMRTPPQ